MRTIVQISWGALQAHQTRFVLTILWCAFGTPYHEIFLLYNISMPEYRRIKINGGIYFFTVVTYDRLHILTTTPARKILRQAWEETNQRFPFETLAFCLLPDHLHCIWKLPADDSDYSTRWNLIKGRFSRAYLHEIGPGCERNPSRQKRREVAIWQRRFWEHTILDEDDLENHLDYIHYNPIKHGYATRAADWEWSSFHRFVREGLYDANWVGGDEGRLQGFSYE